MIRAASRFQHSAQRAALGARLFPEIRTTASCRSSGAAGNPVLRDPAADDSNVVASVSPGLRDQAGGDHRPSAMAPGVRRSNSQIVGCSQDAAHPPTPPAVNPSAPASRPDRDDRRHSGATVPAEISVSLSDQLLLTLRMAATAEQIDIGEALRRAIASYADGLGLQVLASALDLDPELAMEFRQRAGLNRFKGASVP